MTDYKDRNGHVIFVDDVLWDGSMHWSVGNHEKDGLFLLSCEKGYEHNLTQELFNTMSFVGYHKNCLHLFNCD